MIQFLHFWILGLIGTGRHATAALVAAWRRLPDTPGGRYDQVTLNWSRAMLQAARIKVETLGSERVPAGPVVFISNHVSMIDIWAIVAGLPRVPKFVMKKEILRLPLLGPAAARAGHIVIDRQNRKAAFGAYDVAADSIRCGASACVFAEGTRSRTGELMPFKKGPFVLAIAAQVPVVPVYVAGAFELMPRRAPWPHRGMVTLHIGEPISTAGLTYEDRDRLADQARDAMVALGAVA
jgi:1-acyl-sn-glycerol-3-phosphate acyltransferase